MADNENVSSRSIVEIKRNPIIVESDVVLFDTGKFEQMSRIAAAMATAKLVPKHFHGSPGDCLMVVEQAARWGMSPFAVAQKTYSISSVLGYEAQLIAAVVMSSPIIDGRLSHKFTGEGNTLRCIVSGKLKGETTPRDQKSPQIDRITTKNSPLWKVDPEQQLLYWTQRAWARAHAPDVLLGVYTPDEIGTSHYGPESARDITPRPERSQYVDTGAAGVNHTETTRVDADGVVQEDAKETVPATEDKPVEFIVIGWSGAQVTHFSPDEAADDLVGQLDRAQKEKGREGIEGLLESNGILFTLLRENERGDLADALKENIDSRLAEEHKKATDAAIEKATKASTKAAAAAKPQETKKPAEPQPQPQPEPSEKDGPAAGEQHDERNPPPADASAATPKATSTNEPPAKSAGVKFEPPKGIKMPSSPITAGGSWFLYCSGIKEIIRATPDDQLPDLVNRVAKAELAEMHMKRPPDYDAIMTLLEDRRGAAAK